MNKKQIRAIVFLVLCSFLFLSSCNFRQEVQAPKTVKVSFPEGVNALKMGQILEENGVCSAKDFIAAANEIPKEFIFSDKIDNREKRIILMEGYLFPDTYDFYIGENPNSVVKKMFKNTEIKITQDMLTKGKKLGMDVDDIVILASIIQAEAGDFENMKKVSGVFHNRLKSNYKRLESDPTYLYPKERLKSIIPDDKMNEYIKNYSTYDIKGLPVGPICNPGEKALAAAVNPATTDALFFYTDKNGNFIYSKDYKTHQESYNKNVKGK
ncbi:MAG: endolytic transglycosylase MltG [Clostridia bacterium]|nr:endolytic transglycosylase MltG [Clostridia bacterium]